MVATLWTSVRRNGVGVLLCLSIFVGIFCYFQGSVLAFVNDSKGLGVNGTISRFIEAVYANPGSDCLNEKIMKQEVKSLKLEEMKIANVQLSPQRYSIPRNDSFDNNGNISIFILNDYRLTRLINPSPQVGHDCVQYPNHTRVPRYQCAGKPYEEYIQKMAEMVGRKQQLGDMQWGRRPSLIPGHNKTILILGNSHTRQVATALEWQYSEQIISGELKEEYTVKYNFLHNITVYVLQNHPSFYSRRWKQNLEDDIVQHSLSEMDAIVMGHINVYDPKYVNSGLWSKAQKYSKDFPTQEIDVQENPKGFAFSELLNVYAGPTVFLPAFAWQEDYNKSLTAALANPQRSTVRVIDSQLPVEAIGGGKCGHGSSGVGGTVSTCQDQIGHRCVGTHGGIPDVIAWDLVETLWELLADDDYRSTREGKLNT
jgi:hypothetical protein